ncbi:MAG: UDP-N-acetylmuramoyl-L-alanine--D-glutamate ligase [Eubacterium sp.]|nr:UDP-N-acetylmuramoyl-L-alanine--D-glutamate ligase [Eubacterium sp.]
MDFSSKIENKKILIVGLGRSGKAALKVLADEKCLLYVQDSKNRESIDEKLLELIDRRCEKAFFACKPSDECFDYLVLSPGVNPELDFIQNAFRSGSEVIGELELAYRLCKGKFVAITGTNGKTTTTTLVGEIFAKSKRKTHVVGNIGKAVIGVAKAAAEDEWLVTETSSFQLETTREFTPSVSAILNLTPDHLNRHHTMQAYGEAKAKIFANQGENEYLVINFDDKVCYDLAKFARCKVVPFSRNDEPDFAAYSVYIEGNSIYVNDEDKKVYICDKADIRIIGEHNVENVLAAVGICYFSGISADIIGEGIKDFGGVEHRIEFCAEIKGVKYYNDSKGTNIDAALTALKALKENVILIAGGDGKGQNFYEFTSNFGFAVKKLLLFGRDAKLISNAADKCGFTEYEVFSNLDQCVESAAKSAKPGDNILLSPACASWDMYESYERRGEHFKNCVSKLEREL